jgi:hypothetical protein
MRFQDWIINEAENSSNKTKAIIAVVDALKKVFNDYDLATRKKVWSQLTSADGKELVSKIVRSPKTYLSDSEFIKLVQKNNKK